MISARELAVDLSQLPAAQREQLLSELPPPQRAAMEDLMQEIAGLLSAPANRFDEHMQAAESESTLQPLAGLNEGQLRLLLGTEHPAVQRRVVGVIRGGNLTAVAPAVRKVVAQHLSLRLCASEIDGKASGVPQRWWHEWKRIFR